MGPRFADRERQPRPQPSLGELWNRISTIVRAASYIAIIAAAYYKVSARIDLLEFRVQANEHLLERHGDTDNQLQTEIDDVYKMEANEATRGGEQPAPRPYHRPPAPAVIDNRRKDQGPE